MSVHISNMPSTKPLAPGWWCQPVPPAPVQWWQWWSWPPYHHQHGNDNSPTAQHQCDNNDDPNATTTIMVTAMALWPAWPTLSSPDGNGQREGTEAGQVSPARVGDQLDSMTRGSSIDPLCRFQSGGDWDWDRQRTGVETKLVSDWEVQDNLQSTYTK